MDISQSGIELMQHALGINTRTRIPCRNYFLSDGKNKEWEELISKGIADSHPAPKFVCGDIIYSVNKDGEYLAISSLPKPKKLTRYDEYLNSDVCESFSEWLGIQSPKYEWRISESCRKKYEYRMFRMKYGFSYIPELISGEWMPTKKAAKASYKEALKASK